MQRPPPRRGTLPTATSTTRGQRTRRRQLPPLTRRRPRPETLPGQPRSLTDARRALPLRRQPTHPRRPPRRPSRHRLMPPMLGYPRPPHHRMSRRLRESPMLRHRARQAIPAPATARITRRSSPASNRIPSRASSGGPRRDAATARAERVRRGVRHPGLEDDSHRGAGVAPLDDLPPGRRHRADLERGARHSLTPGTRHGGASSGFAPPCRARPPWKCLSRRRTWERP